METIKDMLIELRGLVELPFLIVVDIIDLFR